MLKCRKKSKNVNKLMETAIYISFIFKITNLLIVNLFELTIYKLVIFFDFNFEVINNICLEG